MGFGIDDDVVSPETDVAAAELFCPATLGLFVVGVFTNAQKVVESNEAEVGGGLFFHPFLLGKEDSHADDNYRDR